MSLQPVNSVQRKFVRIEFDAPIILVSKNGDREWQSKLLDISLNGALIERPENWTDDKGELFNLLITLPDSEIQIDMEVDVAHISDEHIGFHCVHIDLESATSLRRLVELNLGDEDLLERELTHMLD